MSTKKLVLVSLFTGISLILSITIYFPILPQASYLLYDPGDIPLLIVALYIGVFEGLLATLIVSILMALITGQGGPIGALMHFIATGTLISVAGLFFKRMKKLEIPLILGTLSMAGVMSIANLIFTPIYLGVSVKEVLALIVPVIIPFNLIKAGINSFLTYILTKVIPFSSYLK
ncbi:MAG: ECF transporter S component [Dictyoglomus sp.]|nr:ECF transporter S component [Dictyoglomus sp.]MCX7942022.1 ECF transporter S component [Dictyoglomaceae bacterium]MDW8188716.1 ECF transporter S component [Dictyoglomus sp.]